MSRATDDDAPFDDDTLRALRESDDLLPSTDAEVARAESKITSDLELPEGLRSYRPRTGNADNARSLARKPRQFLGYAVASALGALAAGAALSWLNAAEPVKVTSAGGELMHRSASAQPAPVPLIFQSRCERDCCAGSACKSASPALSSCASGVRCVTCATDNVNGGPYRLRVGSVIVTEAGQKLLAQDAPLELCISASASETVCIPALGEPGGEAWRLLKVVSPLQDLLSGLTVALRKQGEAVALASWHHAVAPTPDIMCKGLAIQLSDSTETLGRLSAFVEPTHFLELARAAEVPALLTAARRFDVSGSQTRVYETTEPGARRFALVLGPFDRRDAEALRWQVLDHGLEASIGLGLDFTGNPRPAP